MKRSLVPILFVSLLLILPATLAYSEEPVNFPDENLEQAIRDAIDKQTGDIYPSNLEGLQELKAESNEITDLTGLGYCNDLVRLYLGDWDTSNEIKDLSPLKSLTKLEVLDLDYNNISEISSLLF